LIKGEIMRSVQFSKALSTGSVYVRTGRAVSGQIFIKFRNPSVKDKILTPYPLRDQLNSESFTNLSAVYSADQLKNSNLEDLLVRGDLELRAV